MIPRGFFPAWHAFDPSNWMRMGKEVFSVSLYKKVLSFLFPPSVLAYSDSFNSNPLPHTHLLPFHVPTSP